MTRSANSHEITLIAKILSAPLLVVKVGAVLFAAVNLARPMLSHVCIPNLPILRKRLDCLTARLFYRLVCFDPLAFIQGMPTAPPFAERGIIAVSV